MRTFGLAPEARFTDLSLLAYTGARLAGDSFGITETFEGYDEPFSFIFDLAGFRHYKGNAESLSPATKVELRHEPENEHDGQAVQVVCPDGAMLGYINRLQNKAVLSWMKDGTLEAEIFRFNGRPDYPRLFIMAHVTPGSTALAA